jgi:hypothetical protein
MTEFVVCDFCNEDFTHSNKEGGMCLGNYVAYCAACAPRIEKGVKEAIKEQERQLAEGLIEECDLEEPYEIIHNKPGISFRDFVIQRRQESGWTAWEKAIMQDSKS